MILIIAMLTAGLALAQDQVSVLACEAPLSPAVTVDLQKISPIFRPAAAKRANEAERMRLDFLEACSALRIEADKQKLTYVAAKEPLEDGQTTVVDFEKGRVVTNEAATEDARKCCGGRVGSDNTSTGDNRMDWNLALLNSQSTATGVSGGGSVQTDPDAKLRRETEEAERKRADEKRAKAEHDAAGRALTEAGAS